LKLKTIAFLSFSILSYVSSLNSQDNYRAELQVIVDSIVAPFELMTHSVYNSDMSYTFKKQYQGTMRDEGHLYAQGMKTVYYNLGDTVSLVKAGTLGRPFVYGKLNGEEKLVMISLKDIPQIIDLKDSIELESQLDLFKKVKPELYAQYQLALNCDHEEYSEYEKSEGMYLYFGESYLGTKIIYKKGQTFLEFDLSSSHGKEFLGMGCADNKNAYTIFTFKDGSDLKKHNVDIENCQIMKVNISEEIDRFKQGISIITLSMSKKKNSISLEHPLSQNLINLKLDCFKK